MSNRLYQDKIWLENKYCGEKWSQTQLAAFCSVSQLTISKWLIRHEIEIRSFSEGKCGTKNGSWVDSPFRAYSFLYQAYVVEQRSIPDIAKETTHSNATISRWLKDAGIDVRSVEDRFVKARTESENSNWKGGSFCSTCARSNSYNAEICQYCYQDLRQQRFAERIAQNEAKNPISYSLRDLITPWKKEIYERDNFSCVSCGASSKIYAHHIVPFRVIRDQLIMEFGHVVNFDFSTSDNRQLFLDAVQHDDRLWDLDNGITLCDKCHRGEHRRIKTMMDEQLYTYYATVIDNYDGDTVSVNIDLGFGLTQKTKVRLFGVNTPELKSSDIHKRGKAINAKLAIEQLCQPGRKIIIRTFKAGKYGRWLGLLMLDHAIINDFLLETGLAESYIL